MTMSPDAAVTKINSHNSGVQSPQLSDTMKPTESEEQKRHRSSDSRNSRQMGVQLDTEESRLDGVSKELVNPVSLDALLPRIDRLDILLDYLQDKRTTPPQPMNGNVCDSTLKLEDSDFEERCKPIGWVLEEIQAKGTILDRIATLEDRVSKLAEDVERRQCIDVMEGVRLRLHGASRCNIFVEETKLPTLPCESMEKGLHEHFSRRVVQALDTSKDERKEAGVENAEDGNNESKSQRKGGKGKGKLRRILPVCMQRRPSA